MTQLLVQEVPALGLYSTAGIVVVADIHPNDCFYDWDLEAGIPRLMMFGTPLGGALSAFDATKGAWKGAKKAASIIIVKAGMQPVKPVPRRAPFKAWRPSRAHPSGPTVPGFRRWGEVAMTRKYSRVGVNRVHRAFLAAHTEARVAEGKQWYQDAMGEYREVVGALLR